MRYGRVRTFWVHRGRSQKSSFRGFFRLCQRTQSAPGCAMAWQFFLGSSARFPVVEFSWFLRLCEKTQSAPGCAMARAEHLRSSPTLSFRGFLVCDKEHKANQGALWKGQNICWGSSARFPKVELWWFLRLCQRTQSAPGRANYGRGRKFFGFSSQVPKS